MSASEWETPNEKVSFLRLFLDKQKEAERKKIILNVFSFFHRQKKETKNRPGLYLKRSLEGLHFL
jgi:hypothetical protein